MCWWFFCSQAINVTPKSYQSVPVLLNNVFLLLNLCKHAGFKYDTLFSETVQIEKLCTQMKKPGRFALFRTHYIEGDALVGRESIQVDCFTLICWSWTVNFSIQKIDSSELNSLRLQHFSLNLTTFAKLGRSRFIVFIEAMKSNPLSRNTYSNYSSSNHDCLCWRPMQTPLKMLDIHH